MASLFIAYIALAMVYLHFFRSPDNVLCRRVEVVIEKIPGKNYFTATDILERLKAAKVFPVGKRINDVSVAEIEKTLKRDKLIKHAECFKTVGGYIKVKIYQRVPVLRIFSQSGSYYVDSDRNAMPVPDNFAFYVPVASGHIDREYAASALYDFALYLQKDKFWASQIAQIYVTRRREVVLTPVVGDHRIILGKIDNHKEKLDKLHTFYEKGLNKIGWNRYSTINLKYKNQVVCTLVNND